MIVSFAIVAYNEEQTLPKLLDDLVAQDYPHDKIEVLLIDSMSADGTRRLMEEFAQSRTDFLAVKVLENPKKIIPCGHNVAIRNATGDAIIRLDAHATCPPEFIRRCVETLQSGEVAVGGKRPNIIDEPTSWKETLLAAEQSMFGSSIASYRRSEKKMYADSLFCPMIRREVFEKVGLYNELLPRSEDNDMNYRIRQAGYRLCYSPDIVYYQHTRNSLPKMLRQKYLNGYWIGKTMGINPHCFSLFHFVPFAFVVGILLTSVLAALGLWILSALMWAAYGLLVLAMTVLELVRRPRLTHLLLPLLFFLLHVSYGAGTIVGLIEMPFWVRRLHKNQQTGA